MTSMTTKKPISIRPGKWRMRDGGIANINAHYPVCGKDGITDPNGWDGWRDGGKHPATDIDKTTNGNLWFSDGRGFAGSFADLISPIPKPSPTRKRREAKATRREGDDFKGPLLKLPPLYQLACGQGQRPQFGYEQREMERALADAGITCLLVNQQKVRRAARKGRK